MSPRMERTSGILLHITSLPSKFGIGDLGPASHKFVDQLMELKQHCWSILPINPTSQKQGNSPYMSDSAFAGNTLLISPAMLVEQGFLPKEFSMPKKPLRPNKVNYAAAEAEKKRMLRVAYQHCKTSAAIPKSFGDFSAEMSPWLDDYAVYKALKEQSGKPWFLWPSRLRDREKSSVTSKKESLAELVEREKFSQFLFFTQWRMLKECCLKRKVKVLGDLSFYVAYDSADIWAHPELFKLNRSKKPRFVAGVPPDYFSQTGQLWGMPVYDWRQMSDNCFEWWMSRLSHNLALFDVLRLDHFRGFVAYWQVPAHSATARRGQWVRAPAKTFFRRVYEQFPSSPFVAENLGYITKSVKETIRQLGIPGMRVLVFAFDGDNANPNLPRNHVEKSVVYTGTHDTNTVKGWFTQETNAKVKQRIFKYFGRNLSKDEVSWEFVKLAMSSKANLCIIPIQDILDLGAEARMNHPTRLRGNWEWRVTADQLAEKNTNKLVKITLETKR
jgi:4-alpha-glucanotransferase